MDIKAPGEGLQEVFRVASVFEFQEWAESQKKKYGGFDLVLVCLPNRDADDIYNSIKVLTELNHGKFFARRYLL